MATLPPLRLEVEDVADDVDLVPVGKLLWGGSQRLPIHAGVVPCSQVLDEVAARGVRNPRVNPADEGVRNLDVHALPADDCYVAGNREQRWIDDIPGRQVLPDRVCGIRRLDQ